METTITRGVHPEPLQNAETTNAHAPKGMSSGSRSLFCFSIVWWTLLAIQNGVGCSLDQ